MHTKETFGKERCMVHAYKYNGWLYRTVEYPCLLKNDGNCCCVFVKPNLTKFLKGKEGTVHHFASFCERPMIWFFFRDKWFNVRVTIHPTTVQYYVNIASPFIFEENAVKYIDFDLDIKINSNGQLKTVDGQEYKENSKKWKYSEFIKKEVDKACVEVKELFADGWFGELFSQKDIFPLKQLLIKWGLDEVLLDAWFPQ